MAVNPQDMIDAIERINGMLAELSRTGHRVSAQIEMRDGYPELELKVSYEFRWGPIGPRITSRLTPDVWAP